MVFKLKNQLSCKYSNNEQIYIVIPIIDNNFRYISKHIFLILIQKSLI